MREIKILRRYHVQDRDDYMKYNKVAGLITKLSAMLKDLPHDVSFHNKKVDTSKIHAHYCQSILLVAVCRQSDAVYNTLLLQYAFLRITELKQQVHSTPYDFARAAKLCSAGSFLRNLSKILKSETAEV